MITGLETGLRCMHNFRRNCSLFSTTIDNRITLLPGLSVDPKQPGEPLIEFELKRLVVEKEQNGASHRHVPRPFHLTDVKGGKQCKNINPLCWMNYSFPKFCCHATKKDDLILIP